jgi:Tfp pilus assembly protein PilO
MLVTIILIILILHFVVGFGYLVYKLSPRKKEIISTVDETKISSINKN